MKYNLRFFNSSTDAGQEGAAADTDVNAASDDNGGTDDSAEGDPNDDAEDKSNKTLTMTQKELDATIASRLARERAKMPKKEELQAFKDWQDNQKTEAEKTAEKLKELDAAKAEIEGYKRLSMVLQKGVSPVMADYAVYEAAKLVGDGIDFESALGTVLEEKKDLFAPKQKAMDTGMHQSRTPADKVDHKTAHAKAIKDGKLAEAVAIKRKAQEEGIIF